MGLSSLLKTTPVDTKFTSAQNQAPHCWQRFNQYVLCVKKTGSEDECASMRQLAISVCPDDWTEKWDEEREAGNFAGIQEHEKAVEKH
ncbi:hypothetical protein ScalyP_jg8861 [Parmales sp. scaly parma]|nr:hypothetical protein ScalyP_jg8861 [Parmales sp. scaly parma]